MENQAQTPITSDNAAGTNGAGAAAAPSPSPVVPPVAVPAPTPEPIQAAHVPTRKLIGDDDEVPGDAEEVVLKASAFKRRLDRHYKKQLKEQYGVEDPEEIKARMSRLAELEAKQEEARLAQLSEAERLKEERDRYMQEAEQYKTEAQRVKESFEVREQDREITSAALQVFNPKYMNFVTFELSQHLQSVSDAALGDDPMAYINGWFKDFAEKNPAMAIQQAAPSPSPEPQVVVQKVVPMSNGAPISRPEPSQTLQEKTAAPGRPNSMTDSEWREYKRRQGWTF